MSKLMRAYLLQGNKKFESITGVELTIKRSMSFHAPSGYREWEVILEMSDVWGLYNAWKKNITFKLYVEYSARDENGKRLIETVEGEVGILDIVPHPSSVRPYYSVKALSNNLKISSKEKFIREKVQFT